MVCNSGNFVESTPLIWNGGSPFHAFMRWSEWLHAKTGRTDSIALVRLMELLFEFLALETRQDPRAVAEKMWSDYKRGGRHDKPSFLKDYLPHQEIEREQRSKLALPKRQARHLV